jgi:3-deoxy-manno-octulosonate cytidylyltransferase (CMP-KDO synthetase)
VPGTSEVVRLCHLGLYAYKKEFALSYEGDFKSALALQESLEQLDFIHHGYHIDVAIVPHSVPEVNVPEDLVLAQKLGLL